MHKISLYMSHFLASTRRMTRKNSIYFSVSIDYWTWYLSHKLSKVGFSFAPYRHLYFNLSCICTFSSPFDNNFKNVSYPFSWSFCKKILYFAKTFPKNQHTQPQNTIKIHTEMSFIIIFQQQGIRKKNKPKQISERNRKKTNENLSKDKQQIWNRIKQFHATITAIYSEKLTHTKQTPICRFFSLFQFSFMRLGIMFIWNVCSIHILHFPIYSTAAGGVL